MLKCVQNRGMLTCCLRFFFHDMEFICGHVKDFLSKKKFSSLGTLNVNISKSDTLMYNLTSLKISDEGYDSYYALNPKGP